MRTGQNYIPVLTTAENSLADRLAIFLVRVISGRVPVQVSATDPIEKVALTGTILSMSSVNTVIWGCGLYSETALDREPTQEWTKQAKNILAVRGRFTSQVLIGKRIEHNQVFGDPCLLLPRIHAQQGAQKKHQLGILPRFFEMKSIMDRLNMSDGTMQKYGIKILDENMDIERLISEINSCARVISSSLYGLIISHAYLIPCDWTKFADDSTKDFEFTDYYSSIQCANRKFIDMRGDKLDINTLTAIANFNAAAAPLLNIDLNALWNCCPFRF